MTVHNKLKLAILAIVASQNIYAINVDPVQIQSAPGELLYAEMNFRQSDINLPIEVSLASPEDLMSIGASHQPPGHLNFFTRRSNNGTGVITITSSRPMTERELNIIVKIKEGNAARLQHIRTPLQAKTDLLKASLKQNERPLAPVVVVSEKDIALNLPVSSHYSTAASTALNKPPVLEKPLALQRTAPPALSNTSIPKTAFAPAGMTSSPAIQAQAIAPVLKSEAVTPPDTQAPVKTAAALSDSVRTSQATTAAASTTDKPANTMPANQSASVPNKADVQKAVESRSDHQTASSDPLVKKFAEEQARKSTGSSNSVKTPAPVTAKASPIKATPNQTQPTYVVQSNESLWGIASRIAEQQQRPVNEVMQQIKKDNEHAFIGGNANRLRKGAALNLNTTHPTPAPIKVTAAKQTELPSKPTGKTKYRLNQAEMSLVAENQRDSGQVSANQNTERNQTSKELSLKVMTAREKTVKLQRNVTELELALNQKDHRIQLLNARLAQLQQQLKAQQADKKPIN
ncbi:hypothetical protein HMPREF0017_00187 [Acinetobacter lwoffii SH145]|nr:hypothetical protein HMPREF0017_00187 [Acinetobacter lwoffii SH145]